MKEIKQLHRADEVYWTDPDGGLCSRQLKILEIQVRGEVVCIRDEDGTYLECLAKELS